MWPVASFGARPTAANVSLVPPPPQLEGGDVNLSRSDRSQRPPPSVADFVSFGQEAVEDSMSISASEKEEWVRSEWDRSDSEGPSDLQEELIRVMNKAVQELELS